MTTSSPAGLWLTNAFVGRWSRWFWIWLAWSLIGLLSAAHWQLFFVMNNPYTWWELVRIKAVLWYMWGGFTIGILWLGRRSRPEGVHALRNMGWLALASLVVVGLYLVLYTLAVLINLGWPDGRRTFAGMFQFVMGYHSTFYYLAFWATVGIDYAVEYSRRARERALRESQLKAQLSEARLEALRARVHPHFLFNALNTIASLVEHDDREQAYDTLVRLADLLRASLSERERAAVPLVREVEFVRNYLEIVRARYPDRLRYTIDVPAASEQIPVPMLILQPLVENAVKHGMSDSGGTVMINVQARCLNGDLMLTVRDNGPGLPAGFDPNTSGGFGLHSTRTRLDDMYEGRAHFRVASISPHGTEAVVQVPVPRPNPSTGP